MGLFDFLKKDKNVEKLFYPVAQSAVKEGKTVKEYMKSHDVNSLNEPLDKLIDGELPWGWYSSHCEELKEWEQKLPEYATAHKSSEIDKRIQTLKEMILHYESFRSYCYSKNECYQKYFSDRWEHCHNSENPDFEYISLYRDELNTLLKNYNSLKELEIRKSYNMQGLEDKLQRLITEESGILQKDIYKEFDNSVKSDIQHLLYEWNNAGKIVREIIECVTDV